MMTENDNILRDERTVTLLEQYIEKYSFFLIFKPVMENRQVANPDFQLSEDGIISNINDNLIDPLLNGSDGGDGGDKSDVSNVSDVEGDDSELLSDWVPTDNKLVKTSTEKCKRPKAEEEKMETKM